MVLPGECGTRLEVVLKSRKFQRFLLLLLLNGKRRSFRFVEKILSFFSLFFQMCRLFTTNSMDITTVITIQKLSTPNFPAVRTAQRTAGSAGRSRVPVWCTNCHTGPLGLTKEKLDKRISLDSFPENFSVQKLFSFINRKRFFNKCSNDYEKKQYYTRWKYLCQKMSVFARYAYLRIPKKSWRIVEASE